MSDLFSVFVFDNGNVAVFDAQNNGPGEQVPELQGLGWPGAKEKIVERCTPGTRWYGYSPPAGKGVRVG